MSDELSKQFKGSDKGNRGNRNGKQSTNSGDTTGWRVPEGIMVYVDVGEKVRRAVEVPTRISLLVRDLWTGLIRAVLRRIRYGHIKAAVEEREELHNKRGK